MRPPANTPAPDPRLLLAETNNLLARAGLPSCVSIGAGECDQETANPVTVGEAVDRRYVIKTMFRHPHRLAELMRVVNAIRVRTGLPIPAHLCCAEPDDNLPILVMEWMPGLQLRLALQSWSIADASTACRHWGRCSATFHQIPADAIEGLDGVSVDASLADSRAGHPSLVARALSALPGLNLPDQGRIEEYLHGALDILSAPLSPGLLKADEDVRDYLALTEPTPHISAMLDWERIGYGDAGHSTAMVFHRLWLMEREIVWPSFRDGYAEGGGRIRWAPQVEAHLLIRAIGACAFGSLAVRARELISALMAGRVKEVFCR